LADVVGFFVEIVCRLVLEALFEGIWYGLKKSWYFLTGQEQKAQSILAMHKVSQERRRQAIETMRQRRRKRKKKR
jgi:hypothetical protein